MRYHASAVTRSGVRNVRLVHARARGRHRLSRQTLVDLHRRLEAPQNPLAHEPDRMQGAAPAQAHRCVGHQHQRPWRLSTRRVRPVDRAPPLPAATRPRDPYSLLDGLELFRPSRVVALAGWVDSGTGRNNHDIGTIGLRRGPRPGGSPHRTSRLLPPGSMAAARALRTVSACSREHPKRRSVRRPGGACEPRRPPRSRPNRRSA